MTDTDKQLARRDEIHALPAGKEMDALVHVKVFGRPESETYYALAGGVRIVCRKNVPAYSTDISAAMDVLCKTRDGLDFVIRSYGDEYLVTVSNKDGGGGVGYGKTISEAICRAALLKDIGERP